VYTSKIQQTLEPISRKIQKVQQSAGNLTNDVQPSKKVPEVRLQESRAWPAYLVRGAGSVWGVLIIAGVVPFLAFFMLCSKNQTVTRVDALFGSKIDTARFVTNLNEIIRLFVAGNLIVGSMMAVATTLMLLGIGMKGAIPLGIASGTVERSCRGVLLCASYRVSMPLPGQNCIEHSERFHFIFSRIHSWVLFL